MNLKKIDDASAGEEPLTTESFLYLCKQVGIDAEDMEGMTIGMCMDYVYEFIENNKPEKQKKKKVRKATQADFDRF